MIGAGMVKAGYLGAIVRYQASEIAPVGKDTLNYLADGTAPSVRALSRNVAEGLREGFEPGADAKADAPPPVDCPACDAPNEPDAKFCDQCGGAMPRPEATALECPSCNEPNDIDAKFCDACGTPMRRP
ncbi:MAG: zinc ribbon domain-containing protein [Planctomycetota bacterium]